MFDEWKNEWTISHLLYGWMILSSPQANKPKPLENPIHSHSIKFFALDYFQIILWNRTHNTKTEIYSNSLDLKCKKYTKLINIQL